jgi:hypothetical protein
MRYFFDTEFLETQTPGCISVQLISVGIVSEDGDRLYAENRLFDWDQPMPDRWLDVHVRPHLHGPESAAWKTPGEIAQAVLGLVGADPEPEFWAYSGSYDWVALMSVFGRLIDRPAGWPIYCRELKQFWAANGVDRALLPAQQGSEHNALADAIWNRDAFLYSRTRLIALG